MTAEKKKNKPRLYLMGKKLGMTQRFDDKGWRVPCTVIHLTPNVITQVKTEQNEGYEAIQLGSDRVIVKNPETMKNRVTKPRRGHFEKANVAPMRHLKESRLESTAEYAVGQEIGVEYFEDIKCVDAMAVSKGKGYQGVIKRHGFSGGPASHGSGFHRHGGSTGMRSTPGRCFLGQKKAGQMGGENVTTQSLTVIEINKEENVLIVKGSVPGATGAMITISPAIKQN